MAGTRERRAIRGLLWAGLVVLVLLAGAVLAAPLWLRPLLVQQASSSLGRPVGVGTVRLGLASDPLAVVLRYTDVTIGNPAGFPADAPPFARAAGMTVAIEILPMLHGAPTTLTLLALRDPVFNAVETPDGRKNFLFTPHPATIRRISVTGGQAHVVLPALQADMQARFATQDSSDGARDRGPTAGPTAGPRDGPGDSVGKTLTTAQGTYAGQPATLRLLSDAAFQSGVDARPLAMSLQVVDGKTTLDADGTLRDPISPTGADLALRIAGPDMALLKPLLGIAFTPSAAYAYAGNLHYSPGVFGVDGRIAPLGQSDLEGSVTIRTAHGQPPQTVVDFHSDKVEMADAKRLLEGNASAGAALHLPGRSSGLLHLTYRAQAVHDGTATLGPLEAHLELGADGLVLRPLTLGIGGGALTGAVALTPAANGTLHDETDLRLDRVDIARLGPRAGEGGGALNGTVHLQGDGGSLAAILAGADGRAAFWMQDGQADSLFLDLAGLRLGNALLAWAAGPRVTRVTCFAADLPIRHGVVSTDPLILETDDAVMQGHGTLSLADERMDLRLQTRSKHLTVGVIPGPLLVSGRLADLSAVPDPAAGAARRGLAGILAELPGVQLGVGDASRCQPVLDRLREAAGTP